MRTPLNSTHARLSSLLLAGFAAALPAGALAAQDGTGTLLVRVRSSVDSTPLAGAFVRSGRWAGTTDSTGGVALELPGGLVRVLVSRPGYRSWTFEITIVADAPQRVAADLDPVDPDPDDVAVRYSRAAAGGGGASEVAFADGRQVATASQADPGGLTRLTDDVSMARPQPLSGPLGAAELRLNGLPGRHTGILVDGMPVFGARPGAYRLLQLSPFEFQQAELLLGPATAMYGPSAAGGALNLISRRADRDTAQLAINQSSEKGGDAMLWASRRFSPTVGAGVFADFHQQRLVDADDDQWGEFPRAIRASLRPRLFVDRPNGDGLALQVGATSEDRTGGFLLSNTDDDPYREELRTRRLDGTLHARRLAVGGGRIDLRLAGAVESSAHRFDDLRERAKRSTAFGEVTYTRSLRGGGTLVAGLAFQRDALRFEDATGFDYTASVPSLFAQLTAPLGGAATAFAAGRCDAHNVYGTYCTPRLTLLVHPAGELSARVTGGAGYFAPTPVTGASEVLAVRRLVPVAINPERLGFGAADVRWARGPAAIDLAAAYTSVSRPVRLAPVPGDSANRLRQLNAPGPLRVFSGSAGLTYRVDRLVGRAFYLYQHATEIDSAGTGRREAALTPRHSLGLSLTWQGPPMGTWVRFDTRLSGPQAVWDNPYRTRTPSYALTDVLVSQRMGRARLYVSGENLFDVRLRDYEPVLLPVVGAEGRTTTTPWVPARGRVISLGAIVEW